MTKQEAIKKGYVYTGAYSSNKEEMKQRAADERAKGNKACVVETPSSKYSRGYGGMGYSVYYIESEANKKVKADDARLIKIWQIRRSLKEAQIKADELKTELEELEKEHAEKSQVNIKELAKAIL